MSFLQYTLWAHGRCLGGFRIEKVNTNLDDHVTKKEIDGVFMMVEKEEGEIRKNPLSRGTELMKKVFAKQDK